MSEIIMNDLSKQIIDRFFATGHIPHAIIIEGTDDENRMKVAELLACSVLCTGEEKPCGKCRSCLKIKKGVHPDVIVCDKPENKATLGVDIVREMKSDVFLTGNDSDKKVYIIRQAQDMTVASQNAILKIFEEPPENITIILTCSTKDSLLETVLSRGTAIPLGESNENSSKDKKIQKALEKAHQLAFSLMNENELDFMKKTGGLEKDKKLFLTVLEYMKMLFVSASVLKSGGKNTLIDSECPKELANKFTIRQLIEFNDICDDIIIKLNKNANNNLCVTRLSSLLSNAKH